jgi:catechol 2,3-dioxygenase-like lactoylglutathione lyase family enzyme
MLYSDHRMCAMNIYPGQVLLLFLKGASAKGSQASGGFVPGSDGEGHLHLAFSISREALQSWTEFLLQMQIEIESTVHWPAGGTSLYFRDPDQHVLELATPGLWANY